MEDELQPQFHLGGKKKKPKASQASLSPKFTTAKNGKLLRLGEPGGEGAREREGRRQSCRRRSGRTGPHQSF